MRENGLVSVILPVYNSEKYIAEAVDSVLSQTYEKLELIVINDGSTDCSENIIKNYKDSRIVYIKNKKNVGVAMARNKGIQIASGSYIAFIDSDDVWGGISYPDKSNNYQILIM